MVHRYKKCSDIPEVTSGGRAENENVKNDKVSDLYFHLRQQMLFLKNHFTFYMYGALGKNPFVGFWKDCLLAELQVKMSRDSKNSVIPSNYP